MDTPAGTTRPRILISEASGMDAGVIDRLRQLGDVRALDLDRRGLLEQVRTADVLWIRLRHRIDAEVFDAAPDLRWLVTPTTGHTHFDEQAAARHGVQVLSLRGEADFLRRIRATAEHTILLMLALMRHLPHAAAHARSGGWDRDRFFGNELFERTIGLVGYGRLGRLVGHTLDAFGAHVLATDPAVSPDSVEEEVRLVPIDELLESSDVVSLHASVTADNHRFFGAEQFAKMRHGSWFINTARGELVDETALLHALQTGQLAGAALDVLAGETSAGMGDHPLVRYAADHANLLLTPHIGGATDESIVRVEQFMVDKLERALSY